MKKTNHIQFIGRHLVVFFLLFCFLSTSFNAIRSLRGDTAYTFSKKAKRSSSPDTQLPFEEKEKEIENRSEKKSDHTLYLVNLFFESELFAVVNKARFHQPVPPFFGNASGIPLYLVKRVLLI